MKAFLGVLGLGAACAACCAIPLALPFLAGLGLAGFGIAGFSELSWIAAASALMMLMATIVFIWRRQHTARACSVEEAGGCGCGSSS